MKNKTDILETLIYSRGKNVYFDKLIIAGGRGCAIILIYFARKNVSLWKKMADSKEQASLI